MTFHRPARGRCALMRATSAAALLTSSVFLASTAMAEPADAPVTAETADNGSASLAPRIVVEGEAPRTGPNETIPVVTGDLPPVRDAGELLSYLRGVTAGRMGGHGSEIAMRGQTEDRIAVIDKGAQVYGGCPNRMDPPTSTFSLVEGETLVVRRGYQTVTDGPPAPAGTVSLEAVDPADLEKGVEAAVNAGYSSNGNLRYGAAEGRVVGETAFARGFAGGRKTESYKDGSGREVRSAFEQFDLGAEAGYLYGDGSSVTAGIETNRVANALFAGAGMDSPWTATNIYRTGLNHVVGDGGAWAGLEASAYLSTVDHEMNNYTLRKPGMMTMKTVAESDTWGARGAGLFELDDWLGGIDLNAGIDYRHVERDAVSRMSMMAAIPPTMISNYTWPDIEIGDMGFFTEATAALDPQTEITAGLRLDLVSVEANKATLLPQTMGAVTAKQLYAQYYGVSQTSQSEANISALLWATHEFGPFEAWAGVSRSVRTADATERGIVRSAGANSWVGNPSLAPETHRQIDVGVDYVRGAWFASLGGWYDNVAHFITRDTARGQHGILLANGASIYRNVRAELAGVDAAIEWAFLENWRLGSDISYTYGQNLTDDRPLYNIAPLNGRVELAYEEATWEVGGRLNWSADQTRADTNPATGSGLDIEKTPGHATYDIFGSWAPDEQFEISAGVTNLLDATYASYLSESNGFDPTVVKVNEPGRSFYVQASIRF